MSGLSSIEFMRFMVEQGCTFVVDNEDGTGEVIHVNKDNFDEFEKRMGNKGRY